MKRVLLLALAVWLFAAETAMAGDDVPAPQLAQLILRILAYDRNLTKRAGGDRVTIGIVYRSGSADSEQQHRELKSELEQSAKTVTVGKLPLKVASIPYGGAQSFEASLAGVSVLFVCPGLGDAMGEISKNARARSVLTFSSREPYVASGASIALVLKGSKPSIIISLTSSRAEGADLDAALLRLADLRN